MSWRPHGSDVEYAHGARLANKGLQMTHPNGALFVAESSGSIARWRLGRVAALDHKAVAWVGEQPRITR